MRILIACEYSARVRDAFRAKGHDAWSCDFEPTYGDSAFHMRRDVTEVLGWGWDILIGHPPCTFLTNAANGSLIKNGELCPERFENLLQGCAFFLTLWNAPIAKICLENPVMTRLAKERIGVTQTQTIQPWQFGHLETKATCLWLKGLPPLRPTTPDFKKYAMALPANVRGRAHHLPPSPDRWKLRSETYLGIARAMADQWG